MRVVVAAICRDEEKHVRDFLMSVAEADTIVVLDTGSRDRTVELLRESTHNVRVIQQSFPAVDFSVFRNHLLDEVNKLHYDVVLYLDLDERVEPGWLGKINKIDRQYITRREPSGFVTSLLRIFTKHEGEWRNRVHEGFFSHSSEIMAVPPTNSGIWVDHHTTLSDHKTKLYDDLLANHVDEVFYRLLAIYERKEYDSFLRSYYDSRFNVGLLNSEMQHLLVRYAIVANMNSSRTIPDELVKDYLTRDDGNTRFMLARYYEKCGMLDAARIHFKEYLNHHSLSNYCTATHMPQAHDSMEIEKLKGALNADN